MPYQQREYSNLSFYQRKKSKKKKKKIEYKTKFAATENSMLFFVVVYRTNWLCLAEYIRVFILMSLGNWDEIKKS